MTILQELTVLYDKRAQEKEWPKPGYSNEKIGAVVVLEPNGTVRDILSLMAPDQKGKLRPRRMSVPSAVKRTRQIEPNSFWDKSAYVLGVTRTDDGPGQAERTLAEHQAFKTRHLELLEYEQDEALTALRRFCQTWIPEMFSNFPDAASLVAENFVFKIQDSDQFLHDLPAVQKLIAAAGSEVEAACLVTGRRGALARLHPSIKGVVNAQSSGASLVSFNNEAETSHGKKQGENASVSGEAAFAYGTALNALLAKGSGNSMRVGGDTVAFWADQPEVEWSIDALLSGNNNAAAEVELRARIEAVAAGKMRDDHVLDPEARLFILGLAPNSARIAVRYWYPGTLRGFAKAVTSFWSDCAIQPSPFVKEGLDVSPKPWALLYDLAAQRDAKKVPNGLGGDLMRAILTGGRYPANLLSTVIGRIRVEGDPEFNKHVNIDGRRAAMIRAVLRRNHKQEVPMALDEKATDEAYLLGRLFGAYTYAEKSYQERGAGLRQKYIGAASATPARVFPVLMRGYEHNLASLLKAGGQKASAAVRADRSVASVLSCWPGDGVLPATLPLEEQGRFFIGFYHQFSAFYTKAEDIADALSDIDETERDGK